MIFIYSEEYLESYEEKLVYYIWLSMVFGYGTEKTIELASRYKSIYELWQACQKNSSIIAEDKKSAFETITYDDAMELVKRMYSKGIEITIDGDENYPKKLLKYKDRPILLFYRGDISIVDTCYCVAVVGTRTPDRVGEQDTREISASFAGRDFAVVSGFADGVDRVAHKGIVDAGGRTIAILGGAIEGIADSNKSLEKKIGESGVVMAEIPVSEATFRSSFTNRNRITAMVSDCAIVTQAGSHSGTLDCTRKFLGLMKPVYFVSPHGENLDSEEYYGGIRYVLDGAGCYSYYHKFNLLRKFKGIEPILENANSIRPFYDDYSDFCKTDCHFAMTDKPFFVSVYQPTPLSIICERLGVFQIDSPTLNYTITAVGLPKNSKAYSFIERLKSGKNNYLDVECIQNTEDYGDMPASIKSFKQRKTGIIQNFMPIVEKVLLRDKTALESIQNQVCNQKTKQIAQRLYPPVKKPIELIKIPNPFESAYVKRNGGQEHYAKNAFKAVNAMQKRFDSFGMKYAENTEITNIINIDSISKVSSFSQNIEDKAVSLENSKLPEPFDDPNMNIVYQSICQKTSDATLQYIQTTTKISVADIQTAILMLEMQGYIAKSTKGFGYDRLK